MPTTASACRGRGHCGTWGAWTSRKPLLLLRFDVVLLIAKTGAAGGLAGQAVVDVVQIQVGDNLAGQITDGKVDAAVRRRGIENPLQHAQQRGIGHVTARCRVRTRHLPCDAPHPSCCAPPVMLREVAASRKWSQNGLSPGWLDSATARGMTKWKARRHAMCALPCHAPPVMPHPPPSCCARPVMLRAVAASRK